MNASTTIKAVTTAGVATLAACTSPQPATTAASNLAPPPPIGATVMYQVNTRQFSEAGTFDAVTEELPRLRELGVNMLYIMPIHPISVLERKGTLGSPFAAQDYLDINPEFGTKQDFRELVNAAHDLGIRVIIDWVANHTGWDHHWTRTNPEWFVLDESGNFTTPNDSWTDVVQLNHDNTDQQQAMRDAMLYWVRNYDIDGFRCDVAGLVPPEFWTPTIREMRDIKPIFMLAEATGPQFQPMGFDSTYSWTFGGNARRVFNNEINAEDFTEIIRTNLDEYQPAHARMHFTSNHDWNAWDGTTRERLGDSADLFAAMSFVLDGVPLIYNGQEAGLDRRLAFFEKDPIAWREHEDADMYRELATERESNPALHFGEFGGEQRFPSVSDLDHAFALLRSHPTHPDARDVLFVANLSAEPRSFTVVLGINAGPYRDILTNRRRSLSTVQRFDLPAWGFRVLRAD